jgi:hypothetical protein
METINYFSQTLLQLFKGTNLAMLDVFQNLNLIKSFGLPHRQPKLW